jgi:23S rRNA (adenine2503-C2)-methyltransferase
MGCKFCASTLLGLKRNLTANEMLGQVLVANWELKVTGDRLQVTGVQDGNNKNLSNKETKQQTGSCHLSPITYHLSPITTHIVVMGTGEPLMNTSALIEFIERAHADLEIGMRRITVSTCGIVPGIEKLTEWGKPINLAISLHAPTDELRAGLMPINNKYKIDEVLTAAFANADANNRQLMIEYILLESAERRAQSEDVNSCKLEDKETNNSKLQTSSLCALRSSNSSVEHAEQLAALLKGRNVMVNLIPWNAVTERAFAAPSNNAVHRFQDVLIKNGIHTRIRRERGQDIGSACGQLRLNNAK